MVFNNQLVEELKKVLVFLRCSEIDPKVTYPSDPKYGDYSTNVALVAAKKIRKSPMDFANELVKKLKMQDRATFLLKNIEVVQPGFINFWIKDEVLMQHINTQHVASIQKKKKIMVEFAHPNTHKAFHIGHLRNIVTGESLVRLLEAIGVTVVRANYQGDVGMHIAKCLYGILQYEDGKAYISKINDIEERVAFLGKAYAAGSKAYEEDEIAKKEIGEINKKIYAKDQSVWDLYQTTRQWSLDYFEQIYKRVDTHFDRYYFESEVYEFGKKAVLEGLKQGIFEKSNGAVIFPGSKYGLHDRVFITSEGNPTYEGKDVGLAPLQHKEFHPDLIVHVLGSEQYGYTRVLFKALDLLFPIDAGKQFHLVYGWVKLKHGKMSSRTGQVVLGAWLLNEAKKKIFSSFDITDNVAEQVAVAAVKYSFLKVGLTQEIAFDLEESISLDGNSGPYLQYTYARTQSVLKKKQIFKFKTQISMNNLKLQNEERELLRLLSRFSEIVEESAMRYAPQILCLYLFDLAQSFNLFYHTCPILKAEGDIQEMRLFLTSSTGEVLKKGLFLLGITAPEKM
jgi:arginyl-tRNA synthetase